MDKVETYVVVDPDGQYVGYEVDTQCAAVADAQERGPSHAVVRLTYEFSDSDLVWTPNGEKSWPS